MRVAEPLAEDADAAVQGTNDDAQRSKLACVRLGYFQDHYLHFFVKRPTRRSPLINRGYYSRYAGLRRLLHQFLAAGTEPMQPQLQKQVVCLGAGYDTTFFQLAHDRKLPENLAYIEVDFSEVTRRKAAAIAHTPELLARVASPGVTGGGDAGGGILGCSCEGEAACRHSPSTDVHICTDVGRVYSSQYRLEPADLRGIGDLQSALQRAGLEPSLPTLVLSECVLVYMEPEASAEVVRWLGRLLPTAAFVVYEQLNPYDAFGRQMMLNLQCRGLPLLGIQTSLQAHAQRFLDAGWQRAEAKSMAEVYRHCIDPADRQRIERLEIFDEFEEWDLMQEHYCIAYGVNDKRGLLEDFGLSPFAPLQAPKAAALEAQRQAR